MTVTTTAVLLWFLGFSALAALAVAATVRARGRGQHLEERAGLVMAAALVAGVSALGAWAWSTGPAVEGAERRAREGIAVELAVEQLTAPLPARGELRLGFAAASDAAASPASASTSAAASAPASPGTTAPATSSASAAADVYQRLPGQGPAELIRARRLDDGRWRVEAGPGVALRALPASSVLPPLAERLQLATACSSSTSSAASPSSPAAPSPSPAPSTPAALVLPASPTPSFRAAAVLCDRGADARAVLLGVVAARGAAPAHLAFLPLAGPRWLAQRLTTVAGALLHLDGGDAQLPGLRTWSLGGGRASWVLAVPADPRGCERWFDAPTASDASDATVTAIPGGCRLTRAGTTLRATPLVPDVAGVQTRALVAAALIAGPAVALLLGLGLARGSRRRTTRVAPALTLGVLATGLAALVDWRLLWAHRIDLMRDVAIASWRVAGNQRAALLVGASLAGLAAALLVEHSTQLRSRGARAAALAAPLAAWALWLFGAGAAVERGPLWQLASSGDGGLQLRLADAPLVVASATVALLPELLRRLRATVAALSPHVRLTAAHALVALAVAALAGKLLAPRLVLLKLALAYAIVVAGHTALAAAVRAETAPARRLAAVVATAAAALAMLAFDGGVALAITGVGLLGAMVMAGHDAMYSDAAAPRLGLLEREHARILAAYGIAAAVLAAGLVGWGLLTSDRLLIEHTADLVLHVPLAVAALFGLGAVLAHRHRQPWAAWLAAALSALALWGARQPAIERVMAGRGVSAHRVSAVVDPGYALLRDERRFMAQTSAWQAATLPPGATAPASPGAGGGAADASDAAFVREPDDAPALPGAAARWRGQGLAGSRVTDPGVARSIDNDYLPILVARELGVAGLMRTTLLLLGLLLAAGALAAARLPHASAAARARSLLLAVAAALCIYQPLAALGILPLTGISWPGLGIDSPADLWIACAGFTWCLFAGGVAASEAAKRRATTVEPASVDERVRATPRLRRARTVIAVALTSAGLAGVAIVARAGDSALGRAALRQPGRGSGDPRLDRAIAYARSLGCAAPLAGTAPSAGALVLPELTGAPTDETTARFHHELVTAWQGQRRWLAGRLEPALTAAPAAADAATSPALLDACKGRFSRWRLEPLADGACRATFDAGWPQIRLELRPSGGALATSCRVDVPGDPIAQLMPVPPRPSQRIRLVSRAMGDAATDLGELLVGSTVIRLRPGAPALTLDELLAPTDGAAPLRVAGRVQLGATAALELHGESVRLLGRAQTWTSTAASAESPAAWQPLLSATTTTTTSPMTRPIAATSPSAAPAAAKPPATAAPTTSTPAASPAPASPPAATPPPAGTTLDRITLLVGDGPSPRAALFRPRRSWPATLVASSDAPSSPLTVDPLLADDVLAVSDRPRRAYPFGAALPVLGWVNPYAVDRSLGLDGWVHAALATPSPRAPASSSSSPPSPSASSPSSSPPSPSPSSASSPDAAPPTCGPLAPPEIPRDAVCSRNPLDGVLECRVSLQPELALSLTAKLEALLASPPDAAAAPIAQPTAKTAKAAKPQPTPLRAAFVLLRGDTGEILAHADRTWNRGPSAYAPRTPAAELALVRLREDRDPRTGEPGEPGESEAERVDWNAPIAVGSTLKPVVARAAEIAFPELVPQLFLGFSGEAPQCKSRRGAGFAAILGHCPPTTLAGNPITSDLHDFLAHSPNWYQAAIGILGLGLPDGGFATGDQSRTPLELVTSDLSSWSTDEPLMVRDADGPILGKRGVVLAGLRRTPLWQNVERVLGRPLCTLGDRKSCVAAATRRDVCAARALPLPSPGADLRHLVALGPDRFDFYGDNRPRQTTVPTREYLQWLRGSGVHPVGSLAQLTDAFGRVIYEPEPSIAAAAAPQLAASWFPAPAVGALPSWRCPKTTIPGAGHVPAVRGAEGGLCAVLTEGGTAHRALAPLFTDARLALYGAKTGTIDSLATISRSRAACEAWNRRHTLPGRPAALASQPGWLDCGKTPPDDSLFILAFSIDTPAGPVPLTLGVSLQRSGKGAAARLAPQLVAAIADYFDAAR